MLYEVITGGYDQYILGNDRVFDKIACCLGTQLNFDSELAPVDSEFHFQTTPTDLLTSQMIRKKSTGFSLKPYQVLWLTKTL